MLHILYMMVKAGNLNPDLETYFVFDNTLSGTNGDSYDGNTLFNITFAEKDPITSGSNSETIEHVSHMIGLNSRSLYWRLQTIIKC